jgi:hypothetical protein
MDDVTLEAKAVEMLETGNRLTENQSPTYPCWYVLQYPYSVEGNRQKSIDNFLLKLWRVCKDGSVEKKEVLSKVVSEDLAYTSANIKLNRWRLEGWLNVEARHGSKAWNTQVSLTPEALERIAYLKERCKKWLVERETNEPKFVEHEASMKAWEEEERKRGLGEQ